MLVNRCLLSLSGTATFRCRFRTLELLIRKSFEAALRRRMGSHREIGHVIKRKPSQHRGRWSYPFHKRLARNTELDSTAAPRAAIIDGKKRRPKPPEGWLSLVGSSRFHTRLRVRRHA
jgi:hypothetical protein